MSISHLSDAAVSRGRMMESRGAWTAPSLVRLGAAARQALEGANVAPGMLTILRELTEVSGLDIPPWRVLADTPPMLEHDADPTEPKHGSSIACLDVWKCNTSGGRWWSTLTDPRTRWCGPGAFNQLDARRIEVSVFLQKKEKEKKGGVQHAGKCGIVCGGG